MRWVTAVPRRLAIREVRLLAACACLLTSATRPSAAQSGVLRGVVVDSADGSLLENVGILSEALRKVARTDSKGRFTLTQMPAGEVELSIRRLGYKPQRQTIVLSGGVNDSVKVVLVAQPEVLQAIAGRRGGAPPPPGHRRLLRAPRAGHRHVHHAPAIGRSAQHAAHGRPAHGSGDTARAARATARTRCGSPARRRSTTATARRRSGSTASACRTWSWTRSRRRTSKASSCTAAHRRRRRSSGRATRTPRCAARSSFGVVSPARDGTPSDEAPRVARSTRGRGGDVRRVPARAGQRVRELGRRKEFRQQPALSRPRSGAAALDVDHVPHGPLRAAVVDDAGPRLHAVGDEPARLPPDEPPPARGERRVGLRHCAPPVAAERMDAASRPRRSGDARRSRGGAFVLPPSAARGVGGLGHRTARRSLGVLRAGDHSRLPARRRRGAAERRPALLGGGRTFRLRAAVQGDDDDRSRRVGHLECVSTQATRRRQGMVERRRAPRLR